MYEKGPEENIDVVGTGPVQVEESGVKIFYDPCCQWCIYINETIKKRVSEIKQDLPTEEFDIWRGSEALRRGVTSRTTYVNGTPIRFRDSEQFKESLKKAILRSNSTQGEPTV